MEYQRGKLMGTRSLIKFVELGKNRYSLLVTIYRQYDGYIEGVDHDLAAWLLKRKIINGIGFDQYDMSRYANGPRCLAAEYIADHKNEVGGLYIGDYEWQNYNYTVIVDNRKLCPENGYRADDVILIVVHNFDDIDHPIFTGTPSELLAFKEEM